MTILKSSPANCSRVASSLNRSQGLGVILYGSGLLTLNPRFCLLHEPSLVTKGNVCLIHFPNPRLERFFLCFLLKV